MLCAWCSEDNRAHAFHTEAAHLMQAIERSLQRSAHLRAHPGIPASPYCVRISSSWHSVGDIRCAASAFTTLRI
jgi:hypothetical protein